MISPSSASITLNASKKEMSQQDDRVIRDDQLQLCHAFVPVSLVDVLRGGIFQSLFGCCLLVDISGFTNLSSTLCEEGVGGLDKLRSITDNSLGKFVECIYESGGDGKINDSNFRQKLTFS
jgi:hypothetical protein